MLVHLSLCGGCYVAKILPTTKKKNATHRRLSFSNARDTLEIKVRNNAPALKMCVGTKKAKKKVANIFYCNSMSSLFNAL